MSIMAGMWASALFCAALLSTAQAADPSRVRRQGGVRFTSDRPCTTPNSEAGSCINIRQCPALLNLLRNQHQDSDAVRFLRASLCGYQGSDPEVCCVSNTSTTRPPASTTTQSPARTGNKPTSHLPVPQQCGFANGSLPRIVGGKASVLGNWPWMAALGYTPRASSNKKGTIFLCGGALITESHVLTAGHCVHNRNDLVLVRLGDLDLERDDDGAKPINVRISKKKVHENYSSTSYTNDIAVLTLQDKVPYTHAIHPICLPFTPETKSRNIVGRMPFVAGWGSTSFRGPSSSHLRELQIPVVETSACTRAFRTFTNTVIDERIICAGYAKGGKDSCQGDSGGPLMDAVGPMSFYLVGVVSFGFKCAEPGFPGVYTRVTAFQEWIEKNTA